MKVNRSELAKQLQRIVFALASAGGVDSNLAHVSVAAILMIGYYGDLQHKGAQRLDVAILNGYLHPAIWLGQIDDLKLLQIIEIGAGAYGDPRWRIALVQLVIGIYVDLADVGALVKLYIDQVRQLAIGLPVSVHYIVPQTFYTEACSVGVLFEWSSCWFSLRDPTWFAGGQAPNSLRAYFTHIAQSLFRKWILFASSSWLGCGLFIYSSRHISSRII